MRVLADTDAGFASTDPPSSRFTIPRKGRDSWMLLVIPRRLKSQTSERAYIYIYIYGRDRRVPHRGKRRTPMEMLILCDSAAAPTPRRLPPARYVVTQ